MSPVIRSEIASLDVVFAPASLAVDTVVTLDKRHGKGSLVVVFKLSEYGLRQSKRGKWRLDPYQING